jgi:hypothetical protein
MASGAKIKKKAIVTIGSYGAGEPKRQPDVLSSVFNGLF